MRRTIVVDTNPHTEARLVSKANTKKYEDNYDRIFKKDKKKVKENGKKSNPP